MSFVVESPTVGLKKPRGHFTHASAENAPITSDEVPAGQLMQLVEPADDEKLPAAHAVQFSGALPPSALSDVPAGHRVHEEDGDEE